MSSNVYIIGGEEGTADSEFLAREDLINSLCTIHSASSITTQEPTNSETTSSGTISSGSTSSGSTSSEAGSDSGTGSGSLSGLHGILSKPTYPGYSASTGTYIVDPTVTSFPYYDPIYKQWIDSSGNVVPEPPQDGSTTPTE